MDGHRPCSRPTRLNSNVAQRNDLAFRTQDLSDRHARKRCFRCRVGLIQLLVRPIDTARRQTGASENNLASAHCRKMSRSVRSRSAGCVSSVRGTERLCKDIDERQDDAVIQTRIASTSTSATRVACFHKKTVSLSPQSALTVSAGSPLARWPRTRR